MAATQFRQRLLDGASSNQHNPIETISEEPLVDLLSAMLVFQGHPRFQTGSGWQNIHSAVETARQFAANHLRRFRNSPDRPELRRLTVDEIAAIHLYTSDSFYTLMNACLRGDEAGLEYVRPIVKLLLVAFSKLEGKKLHLYRGVTKGFNDLEFQVGTCVKWWSFSSTTDRVDVVAGFTGNNTGERTHFHIDAESAYNIRPFSRFNSEHEWILLPGTELEVVSRLKPSTTDNGLTLIQLRQRPTPPLVPPARFFWDEIRKRISKRP